jgi:membrane-associated protease RseP (regulator of RpoE activity)
MEEYDLYPQKPIIEKVKVESNWGLTAFTIVLFVGTFLLVFSEELRFVLFLIAVLLIHELGHYISMKRFNYENVRMLFIPLMGAFVQGSKDKYSQKQSFIVAALGPYPGILIGALLLFLSSKYQSEWMIEWSFLFLFINIINLVPIDPLDGGQLFKLMMNKKRDLFLMIFALISSLVLIGIGWLIDSWIMMAFGFFMGIRVRGIQRNYHIRKTLDEEGINYTTTYEELSNRDYVLIKNILLEEIPALKKYQELQGDVSDEVMASHVNSVLLAPVKQDATVGFKIFIVLSWMILMFLPFLLLFFVNLDFDWYFEMK